MNGGLDISRNILNVQLCMNGKTRIGNFSHKIPPFILEACSLPFSDWFMFQLKKDLEKYMQFLLGPTSKASERLALGKFYLQLQNSTANWSFSTDMLIGQVYYFVLRCVAGNSYRTLQLSKNIIFLIRPHKISSDLKNGVFRNICLCGSPPHLCFFYFMLFRHMMMVMMVLLLKFHLSWYLLLVLLLYLLDFSFNTISLSTNDS